MLILKRLDVYFVVLFLFLILRLSPLEGLHLTWVPGLILAMYLPGYFLVDALPALKNYWRGFERLAVVVFTSLALMTLLSLAAGIIFQLKLSTFLTLTVVIDTFLWLLHRLLGRQLSFGDWEKEGQSYIKGFKLADYITLSLPLAIILVTLAINPYAQNADNYLLTLKDSIIHQTNFLTGRQSFVGWLSYLHLFLEVDYVRLYILFFPITFFVSSWFVFGYLKSHIRDKALVTIGYLSILAPAVILTEVNIIRPQVGLIIFTLPTLFLLVESLQAHRLSITGLALLFSVAAFTFHELGLILVGLSLAVLVAELLYQTFRVKSFSLRQYFWLAVAIVPYLLLLPVSKLFNSTFVLLHYFLKVLPSFHWRWWFIDHYVTPDGFDLGWPGILSFYYYLYNGAIALLGLIVVSWLLIRAKFLRFSTIVVPFAYVIIYLAAAELLPRIGIFFFPNRAWVHLMLGAVVIFALLLQQLEKITGSAKKLVIYFSIGIIVLGSLGTLYVARDNVSVIYREERPLISFLKDKTPSNSLVISSQDNSALTVIYAERNYIQLEVNEELSKDRFESILTSALTIASKPRIKVSRPEVREDVKVFVNNKLDSAYTRVIQKPVQQEDPPTFLPGTPVYLIFSHRKTTGINRTRTYLAGASDRINERHYLEFGFPVVYRDSNSFILKIR